MHEGHLLLLGFSHIFTITPFALLCLGVIVGIVGGALPGISFVNAMALALPFTYAMTPVDSMVFLTGIYCGGVFGGSISSILINIPGSPADLVACWDGHPMAKQGKAAKALGIAVMCSAIGGTVSALIMALLSPPFAKLALAFDQPEFFAATILGLVSVVTIAKGNVTRSAISLFLGLGVATVGLDPLLGVPRLTFGSAVLENGISFVVVLIGMFAVGEVLWWVFEQRKASQGADQQQRIAEGHTRLPRPKELLALKGAILRGTAIGAGIGAIPGSGAVVGAVVSYGVEKQVSKRSDQFGTGVEEGIAAPEAAKNATTGTATIPMLTLGIPGSAATAIMLAALMLHGVQPGPLLFVQGAPLIYTVFAAYLLANILMIGVGMAVARVFSHLMKIPPAILFGFIVILCMLGAFGVRNNMADIYIAVAFGFVGYVMRRIDMPTAPMILGVILGPLAERYFRTSMIAYNNNMFIFFERPLSATIMALAFAFVAWSLWPYIKEFKTKRSTKLGLSVRVDGTAAVPASSDTRSMGPGPAQPGGIKAGARK